MVKVTIRLAERMERRAGMSCNLESLAGDAGSSPATGIRVDVGLHISVGDKSLRSYDTLVFDVMIIKSKTTNLKFPEQNRTCEVFWSTSIESG